MFLNILLVYHRSASSVAVSRIDVDNAAVSFLFYPTDLHIPTIADAVTKHDGRTLSFWHGIEPLLTPTSTASLYILYCIVNYMRKLWLLPIVGEGTFVHAGKDKYIFPLPNTHVREPVAYSVETMYGFPPRYFRPTESTHNPPSACLTVEFQLLFLRLPLMWANRIAANAFRWGTELETLLVK